MNKQIDSWTEMLLAGLLSVILVISFLFSIDGLVFLGWVAYHIICILPKKEFFIKEIMGIMPLRMTLYSITNLPKPSGATD